MLISEVVPVRSTYTTPHMVRAIPGLLLHLVFVVVSPPPSLYCIFLLSFQNTGAEGLDRTPETPWIADPLLEVQDLISTTAARLSC